ncbi:hypothetical protein ACTXT7_009106 [Hymenolepis weldensis]
MDKDIEYLMRQFNKCQQAAKNPIRQDPVLWPQTKPRGPGRKIRRYAKERLIKCGKRRLDGRGTTEFPAGIRINPASCVWREIPSRGVNESKVENGARSDATEEYFADRKRGSKKNGFAVNTQVYARDYRLGRQRTAAIIIKRYGSMLYDVEIGKDTWVRHHNQLRRRLAEPTTDKRYLSLYSLLDTFNLTHVLSPRSQVIDQVMVPSLTARTKCNLLVYRSIRHRRPTGDLPKKRDIVGSARLPPEILVYYVITQ